MVMNSTNDELHLKVEEQISLLGTRSPLSNQKIFNDFEIILFFYRFISKKKKKK